MFKDNIKAPYECMELKEYKLFDFIPEFFLNSANLMIFPDLIVKILLIILLDLKKEVKSILKIELVFVHVVSQKILLKMEFTKEN